MAEPIIIVGGGIGGLTAALCLVQQGVAVEVHERAPELREIGAGLAIWPAALEVFDRLGLGAQVRALGGSVLPSGLRGADGRWLVRFSAEDMVDVFGEPPIGVHRGELQSLLLAALPAGTLHTGKTLVGVDQNGRVRVRFEDGTAAEGRAVVGADGNRSAVRAALHGAAPLHDCRYVAWRGTTTWPAGVDRGEASGEWWGARERFGFLPIGGDRLTWYASARRADRDGSWDEVVERFSKWPSPVGAVVASTPPEALWFDHIHDRRPLRRWSAGRATLLGDAAHPMTPELGQGACQAIIDAWVLAEEVAVSSDVVTAFRRYERRRKARAAFVQVAARGLAAGGNIEGPRMRALRERLTAVVPARAALKELRLVAGAGGGAREVLRSASALPE